MSDDSKLLTEDEKARLYRWTELHRPEPEQVLPGRIVNNVFEEEETDLPLEEAAADLRVQSFELIEELDSICRRIDERCSRFSVASTERVGSPLFQAMARIFQERTTVVTYDHYKRALEMRERLISDEIKETLSR